MKKTVRMMASVLVAAGAVAFAQQDQQQQQTPQQQDQQKQQQQDNSSQDKGTTPNTSGSGSGAASSQDNVGTKEKPIMVVAATVNAKGTVTDKNRLLRTLTVKTDDGATVKLKIGREVTNFNDINKGDQVNLTYNQETAIALRKGDPTPAATVGHALITPTKGAPPVAAEIMTVESSAVIEDVDQNSRTLKLRAPDGSIRSIKVGDEVQNLGDFQKGDQVAVRTTEAVAVAVDRNRK
jgi:Ni/Co efflux regulator RcnB